MVEKGGGLPCGKIACVVLILGVLGVGLLVTIVIGVGVANMPHVAPGDVTKGQQTTDKPTDTGKLSGKLFDKWPDKAVERFIARFGTPDEDKQDVEGGTLIRDFIYKKEKVELLWDGGDTKATDPNLRPAADKWGLLAAFDTFKDPAWKGDQKNLTPDEVLTRLKKRDKEPEKTLAGFGLWP